MLQKLELAQGALSQDLLAENICDLLDSYSFAGLLVCRGTGFGQQLRRTDQAKAKPRLSQWLLLS